MRLADALAALDARTLERLCRRRGVAIDPKKRLTPSEQAARQLADLPLRTDLDRLPDPARRVLWHLAITPEGAPRRELGGGALPLMERDLVFSVPDAPSQVAMPADFRVQLPPGPGEDRASARALLAVQDEDVWVTLGTQLLGRRPVGPAPMWLGQLLEALESPRGIESIASGLSPKQRRLLEAIEARGAQLETDELLDLERSPMRVTIAGGASLPTRTASYQLFVRGLLLPRARGLWTVPSEVAAHVGSARRAVERAERKRLLARVADDEDLSPARARLAEDPGALAIALLAALRQRDALPPDGRGVRRSDLKSAASTAGVPVATAELLVAIARAAGARLDRGPLSGAGAILFATWRDTGVWDEARTDPDVHRGGDVLAQVATPTRALREIALDLLEAMPASRFAPVDEVARASTKDLRASGAARLLERASRRAPGKVVTDAPEVTRRVLVDSMPVLGLADRANVDGAEVVRLSARARRWIEGERASVGAAVGRWEGGRIQVPGGARIRTVLAAAEGAHVIASAGALTLRVDGASVASAFARGLDEAALRARFEELGGPLDHATERALARGREAARPHVAMIAASAFVPIDDPELRERLLNDAEIGGLFVGRSPAEGLLVRPGVDRQALARALEAQGIVLEDATS